MSGEWWKSGPGLDLDGSYRRCLGQGLAYHEDQGRGLLPAGLVEEIRALSQPPIPWDVELAMWFDEHFSPVEKLRSYARPSRRQSSTPDIPRPRWLPNQRVLEGRTFGVVLDTSGSMDRSLLAKALGSIASNCARLTRIQTPRHKMKSGPVGAVNLIEYQRFVNVASPEKRIQLTYSRFGRINATVGALVGSAPYEERPMRALATNRIAKRQRLTRRSWHSFACLALESQSLSNYFDRVAGVGMGISNPMSHTLRQI